MEDKVFYLLLRTSRQYEIILIWVNTQQYCWGQMDLKQIFELLQEASQLQIACTDLRLMTVEGIRICVEVQKILPSTVSLRR